MNNAQKIVNPVNYSKARWGLRLCLTVWVLFLLSMGVLQTSRYANDKLQLDYMVHDDHRGYTKEITEEWTSDMNSNHRIGWLFLIITTAAGMVMVCLVPLQFFVFRLLAFHRNDNSIMTWLFYVSGLFIFVIIIYGASNNLPYKTPVFAAASSLVAVTNTYTFFIILKQFSLYSNNLKLYQRTNRYFVFSTNIALILTLLLFFNQYVTGIILLLLLLMPIFIVILFSLVWCHLRNLKACEKGIIEQIHQDYDERMNYIHSQNHRLWLFFLLAFGLLGSQVLQQKNAINWEIRQIEKIWTHYETLHQRNMEFKNDKARFHKESFLLDKRIELARKLVPPHLQPDQFLESFLQWAAEASVDVNLMEMEMRPNDLYQEAIFHFELRAKNSNLAHLGKLIHSEHRFIRLIECTHIPEGKMLKISIFSIPEKNRSKRVETEYEKAKIWLIPFSHRIRAERHELDVKKHQVLEIGVSLKEQDIFRNGVEELMKIIHLVKKFRNEQQAASKFYYEKLLGNRVIES